MMNDGFLVLTEKYSMLPEGCRVLCAVSGGADSVCLLHLLHEREGISVVCAHFNHRLRGEESDSDQRFVEQLCAQLGVQCIVGSGDVAAYAEEKSLGTEDAARQLRYKFLFETAEAVGADRIATAHNAEDNAETLLLNLARGAGLKGLCGIPPVRGKIIRPLLHTSRQEIMDYLSERGIPHVEDSSNALDDYSRNRLRHHVLPVLTQQNSEAVMNIARTTELLREDEEYLDSLAEDFISKELREDNSLPVEGLLALAKPVQMRVFRRLTSPALSSGHAQAIRMLCLSKSVHASADIPGMRVCRELDRLFFGPEEPLPLPETEVLLDGETVIEGTGMKILSGKTVLPNEIHKSFNTFYFKSESICGRISVASRRNGAKIALAGRNCTKSLKKLFLEAKMTLPERLTTPVLYDEKGVIAVYGFGIAERCVPKPGDEIIKIQIIKDGSKEYEQGYSQGTHQ